MRKIIFLLLTIMLYLFNSSNPAFSDTGVRVQNSMNKTTIFLDDIVVESKKENAEEKGIKSTINQESLKLYKVVDLAEILSDELISAAMIRKSMYGNEIGLRGFSEANLRILVDGGILEGACGGRKDPSLSHINVLNVKKIETVEGPFDVTKQGSIGGSINVCTKEPTEKLELEVLTKAGSFNFFRSGFSVSGGTGKIQALLGYSYSKSGQYKDGDGIRLTSFTNVPYKSEYKDEDAFSKHDLWGKIRIIPKTNHILKLSYQYGKAADILVPRFGWDIPEEITNLFKTEYTIKNLGSKSKKLTFSLYKNKAEHYPSRKFRNVSPVLNNEVVKDIYGLKISNYFFVKTLKVTSGFDGYNEKWNGDVYKSTDGSLANGILIPNVRTNNAALYVNIEKMSQNFLFSAGLRNDIFITKAEDGLTYSVNAGILSNKQTDNIISGYISGKYFFNNNFFLLGGIGRNGRIPTGVERYIQGSAAFCGNPDLKPAKTTEFDLGLQYQTNKLKLKLKFFHSLLQDYIYQHKNTTDIKTWTNIDASLNGGTLDAKFDIKENLLWEISFSYQKGRKRSQPDNNNDKDLALIPPFKIKTSLKYNKKRFFSIFEVIHSARDNDIDEDAGEQKMHNWSIANFRAGYSFSKFTLNTGIENIFDKKYAVSNSYEWDVVSGTGATPDIINEPGRFIFLSLSYKL